MTDQEIRENIKNAIEISEYIGCDKPIFYCRKRINRLLNLISDYEKQIQSNNNVSTALYNAGKMKEKDWAIHGGIANGLGGAAAGVVTALDIQQQNAVARAHNEQLASSTAQFGSLLNQGKYDTISSCQKEIANLSQKIKYHRGRRTKDFPEIDLLEKINPVIVQQENVMYDKMKLCVKINAAKMTIDSFDNKKATIDGSFKALIVDNKNEIIDEIYFNIPYNGAVKEVELIGYSTNSIDKNKICKIIFIPINLWVIETDLTIENITDYGKIDNKAQIAIFWKKDIEIQQKTIKDKLKNKTYEIKSKEYSNLYSNKYINAYAVLCFIASMIIYYFAEGIRGYTTGKMNEWHVIATAVLCFSILVFFIKKLYKITVVREEIAQAKERMSKKKSLFNKQLEEIESICK